MSQRDLAINAPSARNSNIATPEIMAHRQRVLNRASGNILEIGVGTGLNLCLYPKKITEISAVDPYVKELPPSRMVVNLYPDAAENMHFPDNSFDTVVSTFTLCSVNNLHLTLKEISRILKPDGILLFLEHGKANKRWAQHVQNLVNPLIVALADNCHLNRDYKQVLIESGFTIEKYADYRANLVPRFLAGYLYEGVAVNEKQWDE